MKFLQRLPALVLTVLAFAGCNSKRDVQQGDKAQTNLESVVFARVDGDAITAADVRDATLLMARVSALSGNFIQQKNFARWANAAAAKILPQMISQKLLQHEIARRRTTIDDEDVRRGIANYNRKFAQQATNVNDLVRLFGDTAEIFRRQFERECLVRAFDRKEGGVTVSESEVAEHYQMVTNQMNRNIAINEKATAKAKKVWDMLQQGQSWDEVAKSQSEDRLVDPEENADYWKEWMSFRIQDINIKELQAVIPSIPVGGWTQPLDTDEGMMIVKVLKKEDERYTCARILIRMAYIIEVPTRDEAIAEIEREKVNEFHKPLLQELRAKAEIEYPLGKRFSYKIWDDGETRGKKPHPKKPKARTAQ